MHRFQSLTWRAFFAAIISAYVTDMALSYIYGGTFGRLTKSGMFSFGDYGPAGDGSAFQVYEIPVFIVRGLSGCASPRCVHVTHACGVCLAWYRLSVRVEA